MLALNFLPAEMPAPAGGSTSLRCRLKMKRARSRGAILADGHRARHRVRARRRLGHPRADRVHARNWRPAAALLLERSRSTRLATTTRTAITQVLRITTAKSRRKRLESILGTKLAVRAAPPRRHRVHLCAPRPPTWSGCCGRSCAITSRATFRPMRPPMRSSPIRRANQDLEGADVSRHALDAGRRPRRRGARRRPRRLAQRVGRGATACSRSASMPTGWPSTLRSIREPAR